jgi:hypothetical protein
MLQTRGSRKSPSSTTGFPAALERDPRLAEDIEELERILVRVSSLTLTAREMLESPEDARGAREVRAVDDALARAGGLVIHARELIEGIDVRRGEGLLPRFVVMGAQGAGLAVAVYALMFDQFRNLGLLVVALGLIFIGPVVGRQRWKS